jgi:AI-2 transport protein TqsA
VAVCLVIAAAAWYLLRELASVFRPLLLAILQCYVIIPLHRRLTQRVSPLLSGVILAGSSVGLLLLLAGLVYISAVQLAEELPGLIARGQELIDQGRHLLAERLPPWLMRSGEADTATVRAETVGNVGAIAAALVNGAASVVAEAVLVGIYTLFLLLEAHHFRRRVESSFASERAAEVLAVVHNINTAIGRYLRVKVRASLVLALPVLVILWAFGVKFALLWCVLTFLFNFIPYLGSVISCSLPILVAFLLLPFGWQPVAVAVLLLGDHMLSAYLVEPSMTGRAVGLSPLVILVALSFWGLCWGLVGLFLAVPLTVALRIVLENVAFTRPFARLLGEG